MSCFLLSYFPTFLVEDALNSLFLERIAFRVATYDPTECIHEEQVLRGVDETFVAVPHVQIDHSVLLVRPDDREIAELDNILQAKRIHLGRDGEQHFHIGILSWTWVPLVELACWSHERLGKTASDRVFLSVAFHQGRLRRPVVAIECSASQELVEPGPLVAKHTPTLPVDLA